MPRTTRIVAVDGLPVVIALYKADAPTGPQIDGWEEFRNVHNPDPSRFCALLATRATKFSNT